MRFSLEAGVFRSVSRSVSFCLLVVADLEPVSELLDGDRANLFRSSIDGSDFTLLDVVAVEHFGLLVLLVEDVPYFKIFSLILFVPTLTLLCQL